MNRLTTWYNFVEKKYENRYECEFPENMEDYIPQDPVAQNIYANYRSMGKTKNEAAILVLTHCGIEIKPD